MQRREAGNWGNMMKHMKGLADLLCLFESLFLALAR